MQYYPFLIHVNEGELCRVLFFIQKNEGGSLVPQRFDRSFEFELRIGLLEALGRLTSTREIREFTALCDLQRSEASHSLALLLEDENSDIQTIKYKIAY